MHNMMILQLLGKLLRAGESLCEEYDTVGSGKPEAGLQFCGYKNIRQD